MTNIIINQSVAILCDGNNIERSIHKQSGSTSTMINFDKLIPKLLKNRGLNRLIYFKEGRAISSKLAERLYDKYYGSVEPCHKSADIPLSIKATQLASKVDTIIILSGDSDYVELVRHLKGEGVRVEIAAVKETTAKILIDEADHFQEITREDWFMFNRPNYKKNGFKKSNFKRQIENQPQVTNPTQTTPAINKQAEKKVIIPTQITQEKKQVVIRPAFAKKMELNRPVAASKPIVTKKPVSTKKTITAPKQQVTKKPTPVKKTVVTKKKIVKKATKKEAVKKAIKKVVKKVTKKKVAKRK